MPEAARRVREIDGRRRERYATRDARVVRVREQPGLADVRVVERLLWRGERSGGDSRPPPRLQRPPGRPPHHPLAPPPADVPRLGAARPLVLLAGVRGAA